MIIRAFLLAVLLLALLAGTSALPAHAHGGNFRSDAPAALDEAVGVLPGHRGHTNSAVTDRSGWQAGTWQTWWRLNAFALLPDRRTVRRRAAQTRSASLFQMGEDTPVQLTQWERAVREGGERLAVPFLLRLLKPEALTADEIRAAALLALGRTGRGTRVLRLLQLEAARASSSIEVRESAVLAIGLMRRSDPGRQLSPEALSGARMYLFQVFDDKDAPRRVRAFAIYALSLLADQPYMRGSLKRGGRSVTRGLWQRLRRQYPSQELPVALLTALGMQPRAGMPTGVLEGLRAIASGKPFRRKKWDGLTRSHALTAYARLGGPGWLQVVMWTLRGTRDHVAVRCAAAIALQGRADRLDAGERMNTARALRKSLPKEAHWLARGLGQIALGCLVREDLAAGQDALTDVLRVDEYLRTESLKGRSMTRPYAALALGLAVHDLDPETKACALCIKRMRASLHKGLNQARGSDQVLGAYAVGLGLAGATEAHADLLAILRDSHRGASLRGHCAVALAQFGRNTPAVREALNAATKERISPLVHTNAVRALSLLAPPETTAQLLDQFRKTRARHSIAVVARALGTFGDPAAAEPLIRRAGNPDEALEIRTMSVVALGLIFDPEPRPSRIQLTTHANYPARTPALTQIFNIM